LSSKLQLAPEEANEDTETHDSKEIPPKKLELLAFENIEDKSPRIKNSD
jgi:hypothetical protein